MTRKLWKLMIVFMMLMTIVIGSGKETRAACSYPSVSTNSYLEMIAFQKVNVYTTSSLSTPGTASPKKSYSAYISTGDIIYVYKITSSYCYVSYPTSSGRKLAYCKTSSLLGLSQAHKCFTSQASCTVYRSSTGSSYGTITQNDTVYTTKSENNRGFIIFSAISGKRAWKAGWITLSDAKIIANGPSGTKTIANGWYMIESGNSSNRVLDINSSNQNNGGNLETYQKNNTTNQRFYVKYLNNGYYSICALHSGKYLHISDGGNKTSNVHQWEGDSHNNAQWIIRSAGNGYYYLQNRGNGSYLDNSNGSTTLGNNVISYPYNGTNAQKWKFIATTSSVSSNYKITFNANGGSGAPSSITKTGTSASVVMGDIGRTVPTRSGYTFYGWSTSSSWSSKRIAYDTSYGGKTASDGSKATITKSNWTYADYCSYTNGSTSNRTLTLYAQWSKSGQLKDASWNRIVKDNELSWVCETDNLLKDFCVLPYTKYIRKENGKKYYPLLQQSYISRITYMGPKTVYNLKDMKSRDPKKWAKLKEVWVGDLGGDINRSMLNTVADLLKCSVPFLDKIYDSIVVLAAKESEWNKFASVTSYGDGVRIIETTTFKYKYSINSIPSTIGMMMYPTVIIGEEKTYKYEKWDGTSYLRDASTLNYSGTWDYNNVTIW